jgi:hypothetical protein
MNRVPGPARDVALFVERHGWLSFSLFSLAYLLGAIGDGLRKPLWFDELFSWHIARLTDFREIIRVLSQGIDPNPPLSYMLIHVFHGFFGTGELATRLPFIAAFWFALLFLFMAVRRRSGALFACMAVLVLSLTKAFAYAAEARPYAMLLACCSASFFFWQSATGRSRRPLAFAGLFASLALAVSSHLYGVLLFVPLVAGEAVRVLKLRKVDWPIWLAICAASVALIPSLPLIMNFNVYSHSFWSRPTAANLAFAIEVFYCNPLLACLLAAGCMAGVTWGVRAKGRQYDPSGVLPSHELVALVVLALLPLLGFVVALLATNAYYYRYFLPSALGVAAGVGHLYERLFRGKAGWSGVVLVVLALLFLAGQTWRMAQAVVANPVQNEVFRVAGKLAVEGEAPIVVNHRHAFLEYYHYAPPPLRGRLRFLVDLDAAARDGEDTSDRALAGLRRVSPVPVEDYRSFVSSHDRFWVSGTDGWLIGRLLKEGARLNMESRNGCLFVEVLVNGGGPYPGEPFRGGGSKKCE